VLAAPEQAVCAGEGILGQAAAEAAITFDQVMVTAQASPEAAPTTSLLQAAKDRDQTRTDGRIRILHGGAPDRRRVTFAQDTAAFAAEPQVRHP